MSRDHLETASELLADASDRAGGENDDDLAERLQTQADAVLALANRDRGPDHGRLDRHMHALGELRDDASGDVADTIDRALDEVREYRKGVEGV